MEKISITNATMCKTDFICSELYHAESRIREVLSENKVLSMRLETALEDGKIKDNKLKLLYSEIELLSTNIKNLHKYVESVHGMVDSETIKDIESIKEILEGDNNDEF